MFFVVGLDFKWRDGGWVFMGFLVFEGFDDLVFSLDGPGEVLKELLTGELEKLLVVDVDVVIYVFVEVRGGVLGVVPEGWS